MLLERKIELIFFHVQGVKKIRKVRTMERVREERPRKVAMARLAIDLIASARDLEGQGVSPAWNAAGTRWRTNSPLEALSLPLSRSLSLSFPVGIITVASTSSVRTLVTIFPPRCPRKQHVAWTTSYFTCLGFLFISLSLVLIFPFFLRQSSFEPCSVHSLCYTTLFLTKTVF